MPNNLGDFIRNARGAKSLRDFAKQCDGLSHTHIDSIEKGFDPRTGKPVNISFDVLAKLARGTGADIKFLSALAAEDIGIITPSTNTPVDSGLNAAYLRLMKDAQNKGYSADDMKMALDFIERARKRNE